MLFCRVQVSVVFPYSERDSNLVVATWTSQDGLRLTSHLPLFPDKFDKCVLWILQHAFHCMVSHPFH